MLAALPRLYPILDAGLLARSGLSLEDIARELRAVGIRFLQYRDKEASDAEVLRNCALLRAIFPESDSCLILNDRVRLSAAAHFDGVHLGQDDMPAEEAREFLGASSLIGRSTHGRSQLLSAGNSHADYLAIGPVFATSSKQNPDPVVGLEGVRAARVLTVKPLVAIGGITRAKCSTVFQAGADSVAVLSDLLPRPGTPMRTILQNYFSILADPHSLPKPHLHS